MRPDEGTIRHVDHSNQDEHHYHPNHTSVRGVRDGEGFTVTRGRETGKEG